MDFRKKFPSQNLSKQLNIKNFSGLFVNCLALMDRKPLVILYKLNQKRTFRLTVLLRRG